MQTNKPPHLPRLVLTEETKPLGRLLLEGQHLLVKYPQPARQLIQAFVDEGRRYAATPEGQELKDKLADSTLVRRGRFIWDAYSLDALLESESDQLPSAWLDIIRAAVASQDLEAILSQLIVAEVEGGKLSV
jgi:hypothetical protein